MKSLTCLLLCCVILESCLGVRDNLGKNFLVGFMDNVGSKNDMQLFITTLSPNATVRIHAPHNALNFDTSVTVTRGSHTKVTIPRSNIRQSGNGAVGDGAIQVASTQDISVVGYNKESFSVDGFLVFPMESLDKEYIVATPGNDAAFLIVAGSETVSVTVNVRADTSFRLTYKGTSYEQFKDIPVTLNPYQTFHVHYNGTKGLAGSTINSNVSVAVFSGGRSPKVSSQGLDGADHVAEQMLPVPLWGKKFIVTSTPTRPSDFVRILASSDVTTVSVSTESTTITYHRGTWKDLTLFSSVGKVYISADKPLQVVQFGSSYITGGSDSPHGGDPYMSLVPPMEQWGNQYVFSTLSEAADTTDPSKSFKNYLSVVVRSGQENAMRIDGNPISNWSTEFTLGGVGYKISNPVLQDGAYSIYSTAANNVFQAMLYGLATNQGIGYPAGMRLVPLKSCSPSTTVAGDGKDNDCDGRIDEELLNGKDDDGDGKTDEDIAGSPRVDGNWSDWGNYVGCTVTCNTGTEMRTRTCTNPAPSAGGNSCAGSSSETRACTRPTCPECVTDADCVSKANTYCDKSSGADFSNHKCRCKSGYRLASGNCIARKVGDACSLDADCKDVVSNSKCSNNVCSCNTGYITANANTQCNLRRVSDSCQALTDCSTAVTNSRCKDSACQCNDGYMATNTNTVCQLRKIDDTCSVNLDCNSAITNSHCDSAKCKCKDGYLRTADLTTCNKRALFDKCEDETDCASVSGKSICRNETGGTTGPKTCVCGPAHVSDMTGCAKMIRFSALHECSNDDNCRGSNDIVGIKYSKCKERNCTCEDGYKEHASNTACVLRLIGEECTKTDDCNGIPNTRCVQEKCTCIDRHRPDSLMSSCYPGIEDWEIILVVVAGVFLITILACAICACSASCACCRGCRNTMKPKRKRTKKHDIEDTPTKEFTDLEQTNAGIDMTNPENQY